ncbi:replicative DNA helicase [Vibrio barjaei]|uniref:replicative DNA helicase n=1 Tax=Vibrio barjaei TaxID=1676683 RepID=UPI002283F3AF|nr:replicative DNA helicase [Vibrio barjaei]MCY9870349.1 replicative DNA helicase [Vibrio barjaei]
MNIAMSNKIIETINIPNSLEAEQSVLGGLLQENVRWDDISEMVVADHFYMRPHRIIFQHMSRMLNQGEQIDAVTLSNELERHDVLEDVGGLAYIIDVQKNTPSAANIRAYAKILVEKAMLRSLIKVGNKIVDDAHNPEGKDVAQLIDSAEGLVYRLGEGNLARSNNVVSLQSALESGVEGLAKLFGSPHDGITGLDTGYAELNKLTTGLQNSDLVIVAARPSMGKTTFAVNLCENASELEPDKNVLIFSLEMPTNQLVNRILASQARVDQTKIRTGQLDDDDWTKVTVATGKMLDRNNIFIDDSSGLTPSDVRSIARRVARENGELSMIMVDYLQLMRVPEFSDNRTLEIAEISRSLKALAKELNVPVVALSQLNRSLESRADKRPVNSDLRESGSIEQDADLIMFIYRDEVYHPDSEYKGTAEVIIGKQRNGPLGNVRLTFQGKYSRFENYAFDYTNDPEW